jgi:hypothetical protein
VSYGYRPHHVDKTHKTIGAALRSVTFTIDVHTLGIIGCDFVSRHIRTGLAVFVEAKRDDGSPSDVRFTENELAMKAAFPGQWVVVKTADDALRAVGAIR